MSVNAFESLNKRVNLICLCRFMLRLPLSVEGFSLGLHFQIIKKGWRKEGGEKREFRTKKKILKNKTAYVTWFLMCVL